MKFNFDNAPLQIIDGDRGENYPKKEEFSNSGYCLFLSTANVTKSGFDFKQCNFISIDKDNALRKGKLVRGDVVLTTRGTIGNSAFYSDQISFDNIRINSGMVIFRVNQEKLLPYYLYLFLNSKDFLSQSESLQSGAAQPQLPIKDIRKLEINIPDLETQKKIASILSNYDDLIQTNQQRIALLEEAAQRLYDEWFVKLRFPNHEQVPVVDGVPEGWERVTFADICESVGGGTPSTKVNEYWENGDVSWVTPTDITRLSSLILLDTEKKITQKGLKDSSAKMLPANTILMTSRASIGYFGLIDRPVCTNQGFISIIPNNDIDRMFILFNLKSRLEEIDGLATGSTFKELSRRVFRAMSITLPTIELRQFFSDFVLPLFEQMRTITQQNQKLAQARDALLPRLMSGKMDVSCLSLKEIA